MEEDEIVHVILDDDSDFASEPEQINAHIVLNEGSEGHGDDASAAENDAVIPEAVAVNDIEGGCLYGIQQRCEIAAQSRKVFK